MSSERKLPALLTTINRRQNPRQVLKSSIQLKDLVRLMDREVVANVLVGDMMGHKRSVRERSIGV